MIPNVDLFPRQSNNCLNVTTQCPPPLPCSCAPDELCILINRDCNTCFVNVCEKQGSSNSPRGGVSKGALAGGIVGAIAFLSIAMALFLRYRRRSLLIKTLANGREKKDIPASAETVLNRPNPTEKPQSELNTVRMYSSSNTTIDLDPHSQASSSHPPDGFLPPPHLNPFDDTNSIQTAGTEGTNVIPIALVPGDSHRLSATRSDTNTLPSTTSSLPVRPARSPELNLNLDHVNVSHDNLRSTNGYSQSTRSGISGVSSRNSYMSNASYSSDFLNEAPMIMSSSTGAVRQVLGVVKAEVISAGSLNSANGSSDNLKPPAYTRPTAKSPLASTSFGPADILKEADEGQEINNPFSDEMSTHASYSASPSPSTTTFGHMSAVLPAEPSSWLPPPDGPNLPWSRTLDQSRPSSMSTQAGSVVDIASATRVNVGLRTPASANSYRTTMGRLVTPPAGTGTLQEQQQRALAHAQAQAQAQGLDRRRISGSSVLSATSTRADSILESFPFVPPSPISDRPIRSPPVSPLAQQSFNNSSSPLNQHTFVVAPPSPLSHQSFGPEPTKVPVNGNLDAPLPGPPNRRALGLSTGSQLSTASSVSGLGSFPFQIESEHTAAHGAPPSAFNGRQRASLDTLALTSDLSSYPLGFDRDSVQPQKK
ncbi:hypothetical protein GALMADRAFT_262139 [Galerina marginata CBS 339.88]|uniref:Membrane anchor Opy2 N-terminal domain-containing protein n=1 Tax=Galerina marginata (strain CBS 339.88) TaxID=685588 RepID=A0A067TKK0_GALM3|nr:hypothetical protein GALMADRAFT_262139 [Galerina marginata CBS 339.88]